MTGAIVEAGSLEENYRLLKVEAAKLGLSLSFFDFDAEHYKQLRDRLLTNTELAAALKNAKNQKVMVFLDKKFSIGAGWVTINPSASDRDIIEFLLGKSN